MEAKKYAEMNELDYLYIGCGKNFVVSVWIKKGKKWIFSKEDKRVFRSKAEALEYKNQFLPLYV